MASFTLPALGSWPLRLKWLGRLAFRGLRGLIVPVLAIILALYITPQQHAMAYEQTVAVGAQQPSLSFTGPIQVRYSGTSLDFMPEVDFPGLIRPFAGMSRLVPSTRLGQLAGGHDPDAAKAAQKAAVQSLTAAWIRYALLFILITLGAAFVMRGLTKLVKHRGCRHKCHGNCRHIWGASVCRGVLAGGVAIVLVAANATAIYFIGRDTFTSPQLADNLFNLSNLSVPPRASHVDGDTEIAILGDSTQVGGEGLERSGSPKSVAQLCHRGPNSEAADLQATTGMTTTNLACSGATIPEGILGFQTRSYGPEPADNIIVVPQLSALEAMTKVKYIFVGVGADDVRWTDIIKTCFAAPVCNYDATQTYFETWLTQFKLNFTQLLTILQQVQAKLDHKSTVVINQYYDPFGSVANCDGLEKDNYPGLNGTKVAFLRGLLRELNDYLARGARAAAFLTAVPNYAGHELCSSTSYVQSLTDASAFHPTVAGLMAIAMADLWAINDLSSGETTTSPPNAAKRPDK